MHVRQILSHWGTHFLLILKHRRTRQAMFSFMALFLILAAALWFFFRQTKLNRTLSWLGQQTGQRVEVGRAEFGGLRSIELRDVLIGDFARVDFLELHWSYGALFGKEIDEVRVHGVQLFLGKLIAAGGKTTPGGKSRAPSLKIKKLIVGQATLFLDNLGAGLPPLPVRIGEITPLVLDNLRLGGSETDPAANDLQVILLDNLKFFSPYDPFTPVLGFDQIRLVFSWNGIQKQLIDQLVLTQPTIYVSEDLFLFVDKIKSQKAADPSGQPATPWSISSFEVRNGQIVITSFSQQGITLPFLFSSDPQPIVLDDFSKMQFATQFKIEKTNLNYPEYGIKVKGMEGTLSFSLPLTEQNTTNIVPTLKAESIEWKGMAMTEAWVGMTFDRRGLFSRFGGKSFKGYVQGDATVYMKDEFPWVASAVVTKVDVEPVTRLLSPENFLLNGPVTLDLKVEGLSKTVNKLTGNAKLDGPGVMTITAIDDLIKKLPAGWSLTKQDLAQIALKAFRNYDYTSGTCAVSFAPPKSLFQLRLDGKQGQRNIDLQWNDERDNPGLTY